MMMTKTKEDYRREMKEACAVLYEDRVAAGAIWLDAALGDDWHDRVDLYSLDLSSGCDCVIGQTIGNFYTVIQAIRAGLGLDLVPPRTDDSQIWAVRHGFLAWLPPSPYNQWTDEFEDAQREDSINKELTDLWREEIARRQGLTRPLWLLDIAHQREVGIAEARSTIEVD